MRPTTPLRALGRIGFTLLLTGVSCAYPRAREAPGEPPRISSVELSRDYSMSEMALLVRIEEEASGSVTGRAWMGSGHLNRELLHTGYGCDTHARARRLAGLRWSCELPFPRGEPDWRAVLDRLVAAGIADPPQDSAAPSGSQVICFDGAPWKITVRFASRAPVIREAETCGPRTLARRAFEAHVDSVLVDVEKAARVGP